MSTSIDKLSIIVVTYKRQDLLKKLLESILYLKSSPMSVYIIDNENSDATAQIVASFNQIASQDIARETLNTHEQMFVYVPMSENTGGAGGFSEGVKRAYADGAQWFWLMDDDVVVMDDAIEKLARWTEDFDAIQGARLDYDGGPFFWQYHFIEPLGMYNPLASAKKTDLGYRPANALCFEGALFSRKIVETLGPPDARFFIYWDDCVYGYLASKIGKVAAVDDVVLKRSRNVNHWEVTGVRQLNSTSDMTRYYIMKNRGHMANYFKLNNNYNSFLFGLGTLACAAKELIRLVAVDRQNISSGSKALFNGWKDARKIIHDKDWRPMSPDDLDTL